MIHEANKAVVIVHMFMLLPVFILLHTYTETIPRACPHSTFQCLEYGKTHELRWGEAYCTKGFGVGTTRGSPRSIYHYTIGLQTLISRSSLTDEWDTSEGSINLIPGILQPMHSQKDVLASH